jgi:enamine deaminase RidA (YjgF/YER057c/UK114 family)
MTAEENFAKLNLALPPAPAPKGVYKPALIVGNLIFGRIGDDVDIEAGKLAARQVGLTILATLKTALGSLDRIKRVVKILGMVNCTADFGRHPYVINGCSELFADIWGTENGIGVRSAVGMGSLPENIPVEIDVLFELNEE